MTDSVPLKALAVALWVVAAIAVVWFLRAAQEFFVPLVLAILISYVLDPVVSRLERGHVPRFIGSALVLLAVVAAIGFGIYTLRDDFIAVVEDLPRLVRRIERIVAASAGDQGVIEKVKEAASAIESTATEATGPESAPDGGARVQVQEKPLDLGGIVFWGSVGILSALGQIVLLLFLVYFLLISGDLYSRKLVAIAGRGPATRKLTTEILQDINTQIERYVVVHVFVGAVVGVVTALALRWLGLERPIVWGIAAGVFNTIPYFGPVLVAAGLSVVAFLQFGTLEMAVYTAVTATAITTLEGFLLTPLLMGRATRMNGVAIFVGLMFWTWVWGVWGMLLAVPMLVLVKSVCNRIDDLAPIAEVLSE